MNNVTKAAIVTAVATVVGVGIYEMSGPTESGPIHIDAYAVTNVYNPTNEMHGKQLTYTVSGIDIGTTYFMLYNTNITASMDQWQALSVFIPTSNP
jgi:hypothetical protein